MTQLPDERGLELRELFFETSQELLQMLNDDALKLEKDPGDIETVRAIRRTVHTLKGDSAACGFHELSELAHELEDALANETASAEISLADIAFTAADIFDSMVASYRGQIPPPSADVLRKMIGEWTQSPKPAASRKKKKSALSDELPAGWTEIEKLAVHNALSLGKRVFGVMVQLHPLCTMPIAARQLLLNALNHVGEVLGSLPEASISGASKRLQFVLASSLSVEQISAACHIPTVTANATVSPVQESTFEKHTVESADPKTASSSASAASESEILAEETEGDAKSAIGAHASENTLRVDTRRVDNVLNLVGELIIGKSMMQQVLNELTRLHPKEAMRGRFADALAFQSRVLNDLQRAVMKVRMVPVEQLFRRFPRILRDVAKQCGKDAELVISGQETDLDKSLLDAIAEPMTHLVRNTVSHGIESAEERVRNGKSPKGIIRLNAYYQGNQVVLEVSDDGRGVDVQRVRAKAIEQKLITVEQAAALGDSEALELVFRPGFSTAQEVNEIAGRGVGLDVVRSVLERLKGSVEIVTRPGLGTTFRLKLPLTLAIIKALLFRVEGRLYAIPLNAVAEITRSTEAAVHRVENREVLQLRDQALQVVRLGHSHADSAQPSKAKFFVLVINASDHKLGLIVDALEGEEELVIKAMDDQTVATNLVSGASILGDGRVVLILNLTTIIDRTNRSYSSDAHQIPSGLLMSETDRMLLSGHSGGKQ